MDYIELLNKYIDRQGLSKNTLIGRTGIDRSTFFQILNRKRVATSDQFYKILMQINLTAAEQSSIMEAFEKEKLGDSIWYEKDFVRKMLKVISTVNENNKSLGLEVKFKEDTSDYKKCYSGNEVAEIIKRLASREILNTENGEIDIFMPISLLYEMDLFLYMDTITNGVDYRNIKIKQLIEYPIKTMEFNDSNITMLSSYLMFLLTNRFDYIAGTYYVGGDIGSSIGAIFPYYIQVSDFVLMIDSSGKEAVLVEDAEIRSKMKELFDASFEKALPLVSGFDSKEEYVKLIGSYPHKKLYISEQKPGVSFLYSEEFLNKYIPEHMQPWVKSHCEAFINREYVEYVSPEGLKEFAMSGEINEAGFELKGSSADVKIILDILKSRLHETLEIVNDEVFPLSQNWSISVVENEFITLVPYLSNDRIIFISEKNIVRAFTEYFEQINDTDAILGTEEIGEIFAGLSI